LAPRVGHHREQQPTCETATTVAGLGCDVLDWTLML